MREDLVKSAVSFLSDPKVQSAPLAKKVSFLESKGMTAEEIEEAMGRVSGKTTVQPATSSATTVAPAPAVYTAMPPPVPQRPSYDWRDIFVASVLAGGISYGVWTLAKRILGPWFQVPTQKELEEDKEKLDAQFEAVENSLKQLKEQSSETLTKVTEQSQKVDESLNSLEKVLKDLKQNDAMRDEEFKNVKSDVESLKDIVPKMLDRNKEAQGAVLNDLQNEVKSLKSLLISRRAGASITEQGGSASDSAAPSTPSGLSPRLSYVLNGNGRPGIPAWQMASSDKGKEAVKPETSE